jgi:hypothetical protein
MYKRYHGEGEISLAWDKTFGWLFDGSKDHDCKLGTSLLLYDAKCFLRT